MGRRRVTDRHLPKNVYLRSGTYYLVVRDAATAKLKWLNLGRDFTAAMTKYGQLAEVSHCETMADVIDRYLAEVSPGKAAATHKRLPESAEKRAKT